MEVDLEYPAQSVQNEHETYSQPRQDDTLSFPASARMISIPELQRKIFQLVDIDLARKKTLLALAMTCESFTGTALDLLWRNLDSFTPLIRCLPSSLWKLEKKELDLQRAMTFDDWSVFCKYNHRVRSLYVKMAPYGVSTEFWGALGCPPFSLPLLPNLTSLTWDASSGTFSYIRSFVTQKLTTLSIYAHYSEFKFGPSVQSILSCIPMLCPSISHFYFHDRTGSGDASIALQRWSHLMSAWTEKISDAAILHLSNLTSLRELHLNLHPTPIAADTQKLLRQPAFCALQKLEVTCENLAPLNAFFKPLSVAPKTLSLNITAEVDSVRALPTSISLVSNACTHSALGDLRVHVNDTDDEFMTSISAATFPPLCVFRNLRRLNFSSGYEVQLDDATLLQMAKAWPLLEGLTIRGNHSPWRTYHITADSFISLLQHCPRLTSVAISINWSAVDQRDISPEIPYQGFAHKALSCADFGTSRIRHAAGVAAFISAIAPKLENITAWDPIYHYHHPDYESSSVRWKAVHQLVKAFSVVRGQERTMMFNAGGDVSAGGEDSEEDSGRESDTTSHSDQVSLVFGDDE